MNSSAGFLAAKTWPSLLLGLPDRVWTSASHRIDRAPRGARGPFPFGGKALLSPAFLGLVDHAFFRCPFASIDESMTTWSPRLAQMSLERGFLRPTSTSFWTAWRRTTRIQKPQTTSEKVNTPPNGSIVGTDRTECCIWCCRMGHLSSQGKGSTSWRRGWRRDQGRGGRYAGPK